jgi:hypothetical protein
MEKLIADPNKIGIVLRLTRVQKTAGMSLE